MMATCTCRVAVIGENGREEEDKYTPGLLLHLPQMSTRKDVVFFLKVFVMVYKIIQD